MNNSILTSKEKEQIAKLGRNFNKIPESIDYNYMASRRLDLSRAWTKKLLKISVFFNLLSIIFFLLSIVSVIKRPEPEFYASLPSGTIYYLQKLNIK